jgi:hypothetical protein
VPRIRLPAAEVYAGLPYSPAANDVWACAVVLFTIAVGAPPYEVPCDSDAAFTCLFQGGTRQVADAYMRHAVATQRAPLLSDLLIGASGFKNHR